MFMAAVDRRKPVVLGVVLLAGLIATGAIAQSVTYFLAWNYEHSGCRGDEMAERGKDRMAKAFNASASVGVPYLSILTSPALTLPSLAVSSSTCSCSTLHREEETPTPRRGGAGISSVRGALGGDAWRSTQDYWTCFEACGGILPCAERRDLHTIPVLVGILQPSVPLFGLAQARPAIGK
jgi:hypothetical protein